MNGRNDRAQHVGSYFDGATSLVTSTDACAQEENATMDVMRHTIPPGSGQLRTGQFSLLYGDRMTHGSGVSHTHLDPWLLHFVRSVLTIPTHQVFSSKMEVVLFQIR